MEKTYKINEIFHSLQGEGYNTGRAAVFIRFAGCNLRCPFCDTEFERYQEMTLDDIVRSVSDYPDPCHTLAVLTGGEPTLQADWQLVDALKKVGYEVTMESNGTMLPPDNIDFLTLSPKTPKIQVAPNTKYQKELKMVFSSKEQFEQLLHALETSNGEAFFNFASETVSCYLQPCDTGDAERNRQIMQDCVAYIKEHPHWRLSLQTHKLIGIK